MRIKDNPVEWATYQRTWRARNRKSVARYNKNWDSRHPGYRNQWYRDNKYKLHANYLVHKAIASGLLIRPDFCSQCGASGAIDSHHKDYKRPLDVIWVCRNCHAAIHELRKKMAELEARITEERT